METLKRIWDVGGCPTPLKSSDSCFGADGIPRISTSGQGKNEEGILMIRHRAPRKCSDAGFFAKAAATVWFKGADRRFGGGDFWSSLQFDG